MIGQCPTISWFGAVLLGDKVTRTMEHYDKRTNVYIFVSGKTWECFAESMNA